MTSVLFERLSRHICTITLNRPNKCNALNLDAIRNLKKTTERFEEDESLQVAILGGVGGNFSAGYDLNEIIDPKTGMPQISQIEQMLWPLGSRLSEKKIFIASIEGHASGFGYELALKCDFRVGDRDSRMGFMNRRFGIPIMNGGTVILPQLIGQARAMELVATGKAQLAPEALQYGVLTCIANIGCALGRSLNLARCLAKFDQHSLIHDLKPMLPNNLDLLRAERMRSLQYLKQCGPLEVASKFLKGELGRNGSFDLGNLLSLEPEVTL